ncbi:fungal specific transcription factor domain-containing protein [Aspergillus lucknowensis]|uniref:Uncharacterized protein n=1 Tax=Aspergillus lucknowensis TaxID=176173 RepID=A0ABR4M0R6_9EURO
MHIPEIILTLQYSPSELTRFSPAGIQWLQEKIGSADLNPLTFLSEPDALRRAPYQPLPPKHITLRLFKTYFTTMNPLCPLFNEDDLWCSSSTWKYWKNCTIALAQALLAMPSDALLSMAARILQALDFTKGCPGPSANLYKRILVICYTQEIDFDIFSSLHELTTIKSRVYQDLYSTCANGKSDTEIIPTVSQLDNLLEDWRSAIPEDYRPGTNNPVGSTRDDPQFGPAYPHFSYYHRLPTIHRRAIPFPTWQMDLGSSQHLHSPNTRAFLSKQISMTAARATLDLVRRIPAENVLYPGIIASFVTFAMMMLSALIAENPSIVMAKADVERMNGVDMFYYTVSISRSYPEVSGILEYCAHYRTLAERAIKRSLRSKVVLRPR